VNAAAEAHRADVDGVPVFWVQGMPGVPFLAGLVCRVGWSDETLRTRGLTHLVEHLALPSSAPSSVDFNGTVDNTTTEFWFSGDRADVLRLVGETCRMLTDLPLQRLERERRILRAEAAQRSSSHVTHALSLRFGAGGHGLGLFDELGLDWVGRTEVTAWATERFTRASVAVYMSAPPAEDVVIALPEGRRRAAVAVAPIPYVAYPSVYPYGPEGGVGVAYVAPRTHETMATLWILERRIKQHLRERAGMSYGVESWFEPLTADLAHVAIWADCVDVNADAVRGGTLAALDELASRGPRVEELEESLADFRRRMLDPLSLPGLAYYHAASELIGHHVESREEAYALRAGVGKDNVARTAREIFDSLLLVIPATATPPAGRFTPYPVDSPQRVEGRRFRRRGLPFRRRENERELVLGHDGVTLYGDDYVRTVMFDSCVACERVDESRALWSRDGFRVWIDPAIWRKGEEIVRAVDTRVPANVVIDADAVGSLFADPDLAAGVEAWERDDWDEAARLLRRGLERVPDDATAWAHLAFAELERGRPSAAIEPANHACALDPHLAWGYSLHAYALWSVDRVDEAADAIRDAIALDPGDLQVLGDAAWFLSAAGHEEEAQRAADRAGELFPDAPYAWFAMGWIAQTFGRLDGAVQRLQRAVDLDETDAQAHNNLGWVRLQSGQPREALALFERALELDDAHRQANGNRRIALRALGRSDDADRLTTLAMETRLAGTEATLRDQPDDVDALVDRTSALWKLGRLEDALAAAQDASGVRPDKRVFEQLAMLEGAVGEPVRAVAAARAAVELTPKDTGALVQLAEAAALAGLESDSRSAAAETLARNEADPRAWYARAWASFAAGDFEAVEAGTTRVLTHTPLDCCTHALRGLALHASGETAGARAALSAAQVYEPLCLIAARLETALEATP
jgi:tetratricopeptide (TPR) repeat protein